MQAWLRRCKRACGVSVGVFHSRSMCISPRNGPQLGASVARNLLPKRALSACTWANIGAICADVCAYDGFEDPSNSGFLAGSWACGTNLFRLECSASFSRCRATPDQGPAEPPSHLTASGRTLEGVSSKRVERPRALAPRRVQREWVVSARSVEACAARAGSLEGFLALDGPPLGLLLGWSVLWDCAFGESTLCSACGWPWQALCARCAKISVHPEPSHVTCRETHVLCAESGQHRRNVC